MASFLSGGLRFHSSHSREGDQFPSEDWLSSEFRFGRAKFGLKVCAPIRARLPRYFAAIPFRRQFEILRIEFRSRNPFFRWKNRAHRPCKLDNRLVICVIRRHQHVMISRKKGIRRARPSFSLSPVVFRLHFVLTSGLDGPRKPIQMLILPAREKEDVNPSFVCANFTFSALTGPSKRAKQKKRWLSVLCKTVRGTKPRAKQ